MWFGVNTSPGKCLVQRHCCPSAGTWSRVCAWKTGRGNATTFTKPSELECSGVASTPIFSVSKQECLEWLFLLCDSPSFPPCPLNSTMSRTCHQSPWAVNKKPHRLHLSVRIEISVGWRQQAGQSVWCGPWCLEGWFSALVLRNQI